MTQQAIQHRSTPDATLAGNSRDIVQGGQPATAGNGLQETSATAHGGTHFCVIITVSLLSFLKTSAATASQQRVRLASSIPKHQLVLYYFPNTSQRARAEHSRLPIGCNSRQNEGTLDVGNFCSTSVLQTEFNRLSSAPFWHSDITMESTSKRSTARKRTRAAAAADKKEAAGVIDLCEDSNEVPAAKEQEKKETPKKRSRSPAPAVKKPKLSVSPKKPEEKKANVEDDSAAKVVCVTKEEVKQDKVRNYHPTMHVRRSSHSAFVDLP